MERMPLCSDANCRRERAMDELGLRWNAESRAGHQSCATSHSFPCHSLKGEGSQICGTFIGPSWPQVTAVSTPTPSPPPRESIQEPVLPCGACVRQDGCAERTEVETQSNGLVEIAAACPVDVEISNSEFPSSALAARGERFA